MTPAIETPRLFLAPYRASMVGYRHIGWLNSKEGMKYSEQRHHVHTLETQHEYLNKFPVHSHVWLIIARADLTRLLPERHIGTITAHINPFNKTADMGILIGEPIFRERGYATEAWREVMDFLWASDIEKIEAGMMVTNEPMVAICRKVGMTMEGSRPNHFLVGNERIALIQFGAWREP